MKIHSINNWIPDQDVELVRTEGGFLIVTKGLEHIILNNDGREVLRCYYEPPVSAPRRHWWLRFQDWFNQKFPRRSPEEIAKLEVGFNA
jgi:hypothetical protein